MTTKELKDYLKATYELEAQVYTYQRILNLYNNRIKKLNESMMHLTLNGERIDAPDYHKSKMKDICYKSGEVNRSALDTIHELPNSDVREKLYKKMRRLLKSVSSKNIYMDIISVNIPILLGILIVYITGGLLMLGVIIGFVTYLILSFGCSGMSKRKRSAYSNMCEEIYNEYKSWYDAEKKKQNASLQPQLDTLCKLKKEEVQEKMQATESMLRKLYSKDIVHQKYRNFIAISQIYEYFDTGRCTELEGPNGAYNLFESELRQNIIIIK